MWLHLFNYSGSTPLKRKKAPPVYSFEILPAGFLQLPTVCIIITGPTYADSDHLIITSQTTLAHTVNVRWSQLDGLTL